MGHTDSHPTEKSKEMQVKTQLWKIKLWKIWYLINIPIMAFLDSNAVIPENLQFTKFMLEGYIEQFHDFLCANPPKWLKIMTLFEIFFQLPIAVYCLYQLLNLSSSKAVKKTLAKVDFLSRLYALNVISTTAFCIYYVWAFGYYPDHVDASLSYPHKAALTMVYAPYVLVTTLFFV